jgi:hypothetical protein
MAQTVSSSTMRRSVLRPLSNERGSVLALVVLCLIVFLGLAALAIDLGLLYVARGEAQRAADAAAHAGAVHMSRSGGDEEGARDAAVRAASRNVVRGIPADVRRIEDVTFIYDDLPRVRVWVHRDDTWGGPVRTLFAGVLGIRNVDVAAAAAAEVWTAAMSQCLLPIAIPDRWCEDGDGNTCYEYPTELDDWDPENDGDYYVPWVTNPDDPPSEWIYNQNHTGYSDSDRGLEITLRPAESEGGGGQDGSTRWNPSWWNAFRIPGMADSGPSGGTSRFEARVRGCVDDDRPIGVGDDVQVEPGNFPQPTKRAFDDLIAQDPTAVWNPTANDGNGCVTSSGSMTCRSSPRVRPMMLFNPYDGPDNGADYFPLSNLVAVFIEGTSGSGNNVQVHARFVEYTGTVPAAGGAGSGSLNKIIRIVE